MTDKEGETRVWLELNEVEGFEVEGDTVSKYLHQCLKINFNIMKTGETHIINGTGSMKQCDFHPLHSIQHVKIDENGVRWTGPSTAIHPDIGSEIHPDMITGRICRGCGNLFTLKAIFVEKECTRCYERKNVVNRK